MENRNPTNENKANLSETDKSELPGKQDVHDKTENRLPVLKDNTNDIKRLRGSLSIYMNWPVFVSLALLLLCIVVTAIDWVAGGAASLISLFIVICLVLLTVFYYQRISSDMVEFGAGYAQLQNQLLHEMDVPYAVADEKGMLIWMNEPFKNLLGSEIKINKNLVSFFPEANIRFPKSTEETTIHASYKERKIRIILKGVSFKNITDAVIDEKDNAAISPQMYAVYLYDETEILMCRQELKNESPVVALIYMDNYNEALDSIEEVRKTLLIALIDRQINKYFSNYQSVIRRLENDKYIAFFTWQHLQEMQQNHFSVIDEVKKVNIGNKTAVTISIGIGVNGGSYPRIFEYARTAMDTALGRGGDQVVLKDQDNMTFYGGKVENQAKNIRVKSRVKAHELRELIESVDNVLIMGHHISDADCIGAAIGIYRAALSSKKSAHIVLDSVSNSIRPLLDHMKTDPEYDPGLFVNNSEASALAAENTLLVVVDNNRPGYCECPALFGMVGRIAVIDHHRQPKDHIENPDFFYIEPYASSASEMVSEILQYYSEEVRLKTTDADALYSGIVVDTNNFMNKTGVRTFEAAAYLKRNGADIVRVRKMFRDDMDDYKAKAQIVKEVEIFMECYAISICPPSMTQSPTIIAAQAANELLGIQNIKASFVLSEYDNMVYISARSIDEMNVQVIMEKLGGGGHLSIAGAQIRDCSLEEAKARLKDVLKQQIEESSHK